jgi:rod shape-determining protein MreC
LASTRANRLRPLFILTGFLAAWWLAPVAIRSLSRTSFSLFEAPEWLAYSKLKDLQDFWSLRDHRQNDLIEAGRDAQRQANAASLLVQQDASLRDDNDRLEALMQMPKDPGFRYEYARVIRRDETAWWQEIVIRIGKSAGLAPGQGVVFAGGVAGRISRVDEFTSVVELASSPSFRMDANLGTDPNPVIFQGMVTAPFGLPKGEVRNVPPSAFVPPGGTVLLVTSSLGGVFPAGLPLGQIDRLLPGDDGLFQRGTVNLDPRLGDLHEVAVLVPEMLSDGANLPQAAPLTPTPAHSTGHP